MGIPNFWIGNATAVQQIRTFTFTGPATGNGSVTITTAATRKTLVVPYLNTQTATVIAAAVAAALQNSTVPELALHTFAYDGSGAPTVVTASVNDAGVPSDITMSVTAATGVAVAIANPQVATGPNWISEPKNWSLGQPNNTHDLVMDGGPACYYGFDTPGFASTPLTFKILGSFEADFGLPERRESTSGTDFVEYLARFFDCPIADISIGKGIGNGPTRVNLNPVNGAVVKIYGSNRSNSDTEATVNIMAKAGRAITIKQFGNSCEWGTDFSGDAGVTLASVEVNGPDATFRAGYGHTVTTAIVKRGKLTSEATVTNVVLDGGTYRQQNGTLGTLVATGGTAQLVHEQASDMVIQCDSYDASKPTTIDVSENSLERHLGNTSYFKCGSRIIDPDGSTKLNDVLFDPSSIAASVLPGINVTVA
jgi:hypothetical protein